MQLIKEIEIAYFRSFYKFKLRNLNDLNSVFGKNDSGKSNIVRALSLFFSGEPDHNEVFDFAMDFCDQRLREASESDDIRKFLYVKVTFNTPKSFQRSLGKSFYVKRQWTVSRGAEYLEEVSSTIPDTRRHILKRLMNKIRFIHIPAIKDLSIFERLLTDVYETLADASEFEKAVATFSEEVQELTSTMFSTLPAEVSGNTKIGAPTQMGYLFETLDFETTAPGDQKPKSLTRQRGDGIKARHIPELLSYISEHDDFDFHIWGFEEPENSLDFVAAQAEADRFLALAKGDKVQVFMTTHSPSFYLLEDDALSNFYVSKDSNGLSEVLQGRELEKFDIQTAVGEGFYLPAVAEALKAVANIEERATLAEANAVELKGELLQIATPVVLTEGRTDARIIEIAWAKRRGVDQPFRVRSCETGVGNAGAGNGGAISLAVCLRGVASDSPNAVIGVFDYDDAGLKAYKLDKNFVTEDLSGYEIKRGLHGKSYAALLPVPDFREACKNHENCPIEYLFNDESLCKEIDGEKLTLKNKKAFTSVGRQKYEFNLGDETHQKDVGDGKTHFAEKVVPSLHPDEFVAFDALFELIEKIIEFDLEPA